MRTNRGNRQSTNRRMSPALLAFTHLNQDTDLGGLDRRLSLIAGVAVSVKASSLPRLLKLRNLIVTPDVQVHVSGFTSGQLWPYETGLSKGWSGGDAPPTSTMPTRTRSCSSLPASPWRSGS